MKEAFEIGVSIALSDELSSGVAKAQQEIACLQKAVSASGLGIDAIRNTAFKTASVGGLSQSAPQLKQSLGWGAETGIADGIFSKPEISRKTGQSDNQANAADELLDAKSIMALSKVTRVDLANNASVSQINDRAPPTARPVLSPGSHRSLNSFASDGGRSLPNAQSVSPKDDGDMSHLATLGAMNSRFDNSDAYAPPGAFDSRPGTEAQSAELEAAGRGHLGPVGVPLSNLQSPRLANLSLLQMSDKAADFDDATADPAPFLANAPVYPQIHSTMQMPVAPAGSSSPPQPSHGAERSFRTGAGDLRSLMTSPPALRSDQRGLDAGSESDSAQRQSQGDVFLDGILVGRWISRYLRRESERANNGPNGYNPRRSQLLPGVTVG
jgi:hypothetical protein